MRHLPHVRSFRPRVAAILRAILRGARVAAGSVRTPALALAALALLGSLVLLAAPRAGGTTPSPAGGGTRSAAGGAVQIARSPIATPLATTRTTGATGPLAATAPLTSTPTATDTPPAASATATDTPSVPTATATATATPGWHVVGTYSGSAAGTFATLPNVPDRIEIDWTCQVPGNGGLTSWAIGWSITFDTGGGGGGSSGVCDASHLSGTVQGSPAVISTGTCTLAMTDTTDAAGPWTATVSVWY